MCCHPFHMFCVYTAKVWHAWGIINTLGSCSSKPQSTQAVGPDLVRTTKPPSHPQYWIDMLLSKEPHTMDVLSSIPRVSWVHEQGLKSLEYNQYKGMPSIQDTEHPSGVTRFGENCKRTMLSSGWCMLLHEEPQRLPWMCCHPFHMFCWCMDKVWQTWDIINTLGSCSYRHTGIRRWHQSDCMACDEHPIIPVVQTSDGDVAIDHWPEQVQIRNKTFHSVACANHLWLPLIIIFGISGVVRTKNRYAWLCTCLEMKSLQRMCGGGILN